MQAYKNLHLSTEVDHAITVISSEINKMGAEVICFMRLNKQTKQLEGRGYNIPISSNNPIINAFLTLHPKSISKKNISDEFLNTLHVGKISFIPVWGDQSDYCWRIKSCGNVSCPCFLQKTHYCWVESTKIDIEDKSINIDKCLKCNLFSPIGIFIIKKKPMRKLLKITTFIHEHFGSVLKNSIAFETVSDTSIKDALTGILNRRAFMNELTTIHKIAMRYKNDLSVCMFDIDHFKKFNDKYGHQTGDYVLASLATLIKTSVREADIFARYGGEEFIIIFPGTNATDAYNVAETLRRKVQAGIFKYEGNDLSITISMGVTSLMSADTVEQLIKRADEALYLSKRTRNAVTLLHKDNKQLLEEVAL